MALRMAGRNPVKFEWTDDVAATTVTIQPDDPSEVLRAKLQRVLDLEQGLPARAPGAALRAAQAEFPPLIDVAAMEAAVTSVGWEALAETNVENLPEYG